MDPKLNLLKKKKKKKKKTLKIHIYIYIYILLIRFICIFNHFYYNNNQL